MKYLKCFETILGFSELKQKLEDILSKTLMIKSFNGPRYVNSHMWQDLSNELEELKKEHQYLNDVKYDNIFEDFLHKCYSIGLCDAIKGTGFKSTFPSNETKLKAVKHYLNKGADVNYDNDGYPPLSIATSSTHYKNFNEKECLDIVKELINAGANVNYKYKNSNMYQSSTCSDYLKNATGNDYIELVRYLVKHPDIKLGDILLHGFKLENENNSKERAAAIEKDKIILDILIKAGADWTPRLEGRSCSGNMCDDKKDFYEMLSEKNKKYIRNKYPIEYEKYLMQKEAEKYNL
jgi:hypothetical protein